MFARPTADEIWLGAAQRAALSQLSRPAQIRLIAGPNSSGKTTLLQYLGRQLHSGAVVLQCRGPKDDASAVLASLLLGADLAPWDLSEVEQRNLLTVFLQQRHSQNRRVLVLVDDAHNFEPPALEELERLLAFKIDKKPALELLVAGPASIAEHWQQVRARLTAGDVVVHGLGAASQEDLIGYLEWRLGRFEMQSFMTPVALQMIARLSGGRYAAADVLSQMSLLILRQLTLERADARVVRQAVATLVARQSAKLEADRPRGDKRSDAPPQGYIVVSRGGKVISRVTLRQRTLIGRSEHNDICLPSPYLSRHHAVIVGTPEGYYLVDLNSVNGVLLNGERIERSALCDEDVLGLGPFRLKVQVPEWLTQGSPLPDEASLSETAVMPQQTEENAAIWRIK
ncbi:MAG TPA: FHA domain-containing protein [Gammaproteobacteria bacterium]|nr:FHA domain-containing protein [Gammaproteobacteria bacterium]